MMMLNYCGLAIIIKDVLGKSNEEKRGNVDKIMNIKNEYKRHFLYRPVGILLLP